MRRRIILMTTLCGLAVVVACGRQSPKKAEQAATTTSSEAKPAELVATQRTDATKGSLDLGGECLPRVGYRPMAITVKQEDELRAKGDWESLITAAKQDVRSD